MHEMLHVLNSIPVVGQVGDMLPTVAALYEAQK